MECLSQLIKTCGKDLDTEQGKKLMDQYFEKMDRRSKSNKFPPRIRFLLKDVIELRANQWVPRKIGGIQTEGPVPIRQIRSQDEDNLIRTPFANRRDTRGDRENDNWMNRFPSNLQSGYDILSSLSVASPSTIISPNFNNTNRSYNNQRNNQNYNNMNGNNRYNKHNSPANGQSYNNNSNNQSTPFSGSNNLMAPRFKKNLITATQEAVENLQMRPQANSLLFKAANHNKTPTLPISTAQSSTPLLSTPSAEFSSSTSASASKLSLESDKDQQFKSTSSSPNLMSAASTATPKMNSLKASEKPSESPATPAQSVTNNQKGSNKQGKKEKGPSKDEVIKKCVTLVSESLKAADFDLEEVHNQFQELKVPEKHMKDVTIAVFNDYLDDPQEKSCERIIELLKKLRQSKKLAENALIEAFRQIINKIGEKEAAIPKIKTYIATIQSKAVESGLIKLSDVANFAENGQNHPLLLLVLQQLHKSMGGDALETAFKSSKVDLMKCLPECDRNKDRLAEILEDRGLSFLYPMLKTALMSVLLKYITADTTLTEDTDIKKYPEKSVIEKEESIFHKYCQILVTFLNGNMDLQLVAIYALQVFCYQASFPKGMLCRWFKNLYEASVIEEETFLRWKEELTDENEYPGKGSSLFQVNQWLTWLEEAESEEEDDDEEKKDKATEK
uniref:Eukaryotic translation initiation factor 4 gamma 2 n=1 Tax=Megaselia scalaris TaxID=36166 RepID=T1GDV4_MEGSC